MATSPTAKPATPTTPAAKATRTKATTAKVVTPKATTSAVANKAVPVAKALAVRISHADCTHEAKGSAGKKARAACRRDRAAAEAAK